MEARRGKYPPLATINEVNNCYILQKQHCHTIIHINVHYSTKMENSNLHRYRLTLAFLQQLLDFLPKHLIVFYRKKKI